MLAIRRGEKEDFLFMRVEVPLERVSHIAVGDWVSGNDQCAEQIRLATEDGCKRLLMPSMETEMCLLGKKRADETAIQVFATETIPKDMRLRIDFHGMINGKRKPGIGQASPIPVKPGVTTPYFASFTIPKTPGLSHVIAVIYASSTGGFGDKILVTDASVPVK